MRPTCSATTWSWSSCRYAGGLAYILLLKIDCWTVAMVNGAGSAAFSFFFSCCSATHGTSSPWPSNPDSSPVPQYIVKLTAQYFDEASRRKSMEGSVPHEEASLLAHEEGTSAPGVNLGYVVLPGFIYILGKSAWRVMFSVMGFPMFLFRNHCAVLASLKPLPPPLNWVF